MGALPARLVRRGADARHHRGRFPRACRRLALATPTRRAASSPNAASPTRWPILRRLDARAVAARAVASYGGRHERRADLAGRIAGLRARASSEYGRHRPPGRALKPMPGPLLRGSAPSPGPCRPSPRPRLSPVGGICLGDRPGRARPGDDARADGPAGGDGQRSRSGPADAAGARRQQRAPAGRSAGAMMLRGRRGRRRSPVRSTCPRPAFSRMAPPRSPMPSLPSCRGAGPSPILDFPAGGAGLSLPRQWPWSRAAPRSPWPEVFFPPWH